MTLIDKYALRQGAQVNTELLHKVVRYLVTGAPVGNEYMLSLFSISHDKQVPGLARGAGWAWLPDHNAFFRWLSEEYDLPNPPQGARAAIRVADAVAWMEKVTEAAATRRAIVAMAPEDEADAVR
jgi:hypothetical protein